MSLLQIPDAYELTLRSELKEIGLTGTVLRHKKSGARVICLPSEDDNKVFAIAFRTPPIDDTGLPHILEHSVLCGSDKYPIKDPFMELSKSSLNTFLNAMTYPDKTIYPVASCNEKDFKNLMDVYLDAVFHPLIHSNENIFRQEGWRYELESAEAPLKLNGVVYSEMRGAFSSSDEILSRMAFHTLYPDTAYGFESGGDPAYIPELSYESFCAFHKKLYHPSNSYIFLYGDLDMEERLRYLDEAYLSDYDAVVIDSALTKQPAFSERRTAVISYPIGAEEEEEDRSYYAMQWAVGDVFDSRLSNAMDVLETVLLTAPGAPLKQALLDAGFAKDVYGGYSNYILQPRFQVVAQDAAAGEPEKFTELVEKSLTEIVRKGLNPKTIAATISSKEFQMREADFGGLSKGLVYCLQILQTWLHDGEDPFLYLRYEDDFAFLRSHTDDGYFESLIERYFLKNPHGSLIEMDPEKGKTERDAEALQEKLDAYKETLSADEIEALLEKGRRLKAYQETEETPEEKACVPKLARADLTKEARVSLNQEADLGKARLVYRTLPTAGIAYTEFWFSLAPVPQEHLPWLGLLKACFSVVSTEKRDYRDLSDEIMEKTGGLSFSIQSPHAKDGTLQPYVCVKMKAIYEKFDDATALLAEICRKSLFSDTKRLYELLSECLLTLRMQLNGNGFLYAAERAGSYFDSGSVLSDLTGGLGFYRFISGLAEHFEERKEEIAAMLKTVAEELFASDGLIINLTCEERALERTKKTLSLFAEGMPSGREACFSLPAPVQRNEGLKTTGMVGYVAQAGSYLQAGPYRGSLNVLRSLLSMDYLWQKLRVLGGAYGAFCLFSQTDGTGTFVSYRDPNIRSTKETYEAIPAYLEGLELPDEVLDGLVISTIGGIDTPRTPSVQGSADFVNYLSGITPEDQQRVRDEIIGCSQADLVALAPYMRAVLKNNYFCTFGAAAKIEEEKDLFDNIESI